MFSSTPAALTGLSSTSLLQPATLPQVLGILAFVYAGASAYYMLGFRDMGLRVQGLRCGQHTTDLRMRGFSLWSWLCVWSGSKWLCCLHVTGKVRCWAYLLLCTQVCHTAGSSLCWGSGVYEPPVGAFLTWCRCQPLEVGNPALLRPVSAAMPDNVSILIGKHPEG